MVKENLALLELIKYLEISLYGEKRNNTNWLNTVLHDDLLKISKSGYVYTKKTIIRPSAHQFGNYLRIISGN
ncbi:hypothetical protein ABLA30_22745 [Xenorhabdus nematophila]|uniref:hypothetical protein n=1 Tax=Xenorhabdus nematophila TaxID=628 RepID=UPI0003275511|nr:hypothetical protein [Xenorhabdus nematophila]CCW29972.1 hypothetical protein XNC3_1750001 [Xenorhabdus nematophila F1]CEE91777.1 hypothetical protein XNA1_2380005 [Xenorhabdus nematophila str. Anatoliense]